MSGVKSLTFGDGTPVNVEEIKALPGGEVVDGDPVKPESGQEGQEGQEGEQGSGAEGDQGTDSGTEEFGIVADGTEVDLAMQNVEPWVRDLRRRFRDIQKENTALKAGQRAPVASSPVVKDPGPEPQLENFDLTTDYAEALRKWHKAVADHRVAATEAQRTAEKEKADWDNKVGSYKKQSAELVTKLKLGDFDDYEAIVFAELSEVQQGLIIHACENPALVIATLATSPTKLREFAGMSDNALYVAKIAKFETTLNITPRKPRTPPEKSISGGSNEGAGSAVAGSDAKADELLAQASKTGNMKPYQDYMRQKRAAAAGKK